MGQKKHVPRDGFVEAEEPLTKRQRTEEDADKLEGKFCSI